MAERECVVCTRSAYIWCENCAELEDTGRPLDVRWYCTALCKESDKLTHQMSCSGMGENKDLLLRANRAGELAVVIFYAFIEHTWSYDISSIVLTPDQRGELRAVEVTHGPGHDNGPGGESVCEQQAGGWLYKIPQDVFKSPAEHKGKLILLADQQSIWAFMNMGFIVQALFEDLIDDADKDIKEVVHRLPIGTRRMVRHQDRYSFQITRKDLPYPDIDANGDIKGVYRITLKDGTQIALDLAGAQYDLPHVPVTLWSTYLNRSARHIKYRVPFRAHYDKHMRHMKDYKNITHLTIVLEQQMSLEGMLNGCRITTPGFVLADLRFGTDEQFQDCKHRLELAVHECLQKRPREIDSGDNTMCVVAPFDLRHPKVIEKMDKAAMGKSALFNLGEMEKFDWSKLSEMIKMPGDTVAYVEKKKAKLLLQYRCVYKMPGDWRLVFLENDLPSDKVPKECVSENPNWHGKKK